MKSREKRVRPQRALIVGAGLTGLATAIGLRQAGYEVEIFEQQPTPESGEFGIEIHRNGMKALDLLGALDAVSKLGCAVERTHLKTHAGRLLRSVGVRDRGERPGYATRVYPRADLQRALCDQLPREILHTGKRCVTFSQSSQGVEIEFADGSRATGDLLIGADGIDSTVRQSLHGPGRGSEDARSAGYVTWASTMPLEHPALTPGYHARYEGAGSRAGIHDVGEGRWYWWATTKQAPVSEQSRTGAAAERDGVDKEELLRAFAGWAPEVRHAIRATPAGRICEIRTRERAPLEVWGRGRVTLLGDAAHPMPPSLGQGACMGLEDAAVLVECLKAEPSVVEALLRYERLRIPRTTRVMEAARRASAMQSLGGSLGARVRATLIARAPSALLDRQTEALASFALPEVLASRAESAPGTPAARPPMVVVTGASSGIGRAIAVALARSGYLVLAGVRQAQAEREMEQFGLETLRPVRLDVLQESDVQGVTATVEELAGRGHPLAGLVNNAGIAVLSPLEAVDAKTLQEQLGVNTTGAHAMTRALLPQLLAARGRVINVGSPVGSIRPPFLGPYAASKAALEALSDVWRRELAGTGVHVSMLVPGAVMTPVWDKMALSVRRVLAQGDAGLNARHGRALERFAQLNEQSAVRSRLSADDVAGVVLEILRSKKPRTRYDVGQGTGVANVAGRVLPAALIDRAYRRILRAGEAQEVRA